ncbi:ATP-binding protein [Streptomyces sp. NA04227]|uniref:ATP-binding protein n=1 Tax=Streptomyces sp. NA04227 TaxID=2742136 RepID=UPI00158FAEC5|nr:ATP-binding protein [Streptomyces sp. NA04227]QKW06156.1 ATP-binding protein [Streptomyces sp. NA04227]
MSEVPHLPCLWRFPAHPTSVRRARNAIAGALPHGLGEELSADLGLLTSELVTNAIRHGACQEDGDRVELVLWPADGHYWIGVSDPGTGAAAGAGKGHGKPELAYPGAESESGRGLLLVDHLAAAWTVRPRPFRGTSVIAGLPFQRGG